MKNWLWAKSFVILKSKGEKECAYVVIQLAKKLAWRKKTIDRKFSTKSNGSRTKFEFSIGAFKMLLKLPWQSSIAVFVSTKRPFNVKQSWWRYKKYFFRIDFWLQEKIAETCHFQIVSLFCSTKDPAKFDSFSASERNHNFDCS